MERILIRLRNHLGWIILGKVLVIVGLFYAFFSPANRLDVDAEMAAGHLLRTEVEITPHAASSTENINPTAIIGD